MCPQQIHKVEHARAFVKNFGSINHLLAADMIPGKEDVKFVTYG